MVFSPPTKISPKSPKADAFGKRIASKAPQKIPSEIRLIKLVFFQVRMIR